MPDDPKAQAILKRFKELETERQTYEGPWQNIRHLVRPGTSDFTVWQSQGQTRTDNIYDGTAPQALRDLASALQTNLVNPTDRWFSVEIPNMRLIEDDDEALEWLDVVADTIFDEYANPSVNHQSAMHEAFLDIGAFGTANVYQEWNPLERHILFRTYPLAATYIAENSKGLVDTEYRCCAFTKRQLEQEFGEDALPAKVRENTEENKQWETIHAVYPRTDRNPNKYNPQNMKFASCWLLKEESHILKEGGFNSFPYHVVRWEKLAGEVYGRGPAINCLPDIRMLNRMEYTLIKMAQKVADPPIVAPSDGFLGQVKTFPGAVMYKEPGVDPLEVLELKANLPYAEDKAEQKRETIRSAFYAEWVKLERKKERQTAYEISEKIEEQLRMMAPMLGRQQTELLNPKIARTYELLHAAGRFPPAPESLMREKLKVVYISPAARAQRATKAISIGRYFQEITPVVQLKPEVADAINFDAAMQKLARLRGIDPEVINSPETIVAIRKERADQQQAAMLAETLEPASKAMLNIAQAQNQGQAA